MHIATRSSLFFTGSLAVILGGAVAVISMEATGAGPWPGLAVAFLVALMGLRKPLRRLRVARRPLSDEVTQWMRAHVPMRTVLDPRERSRFDRDVGFVLDEWVFEGVGGVEVTEQDRAAVAAGVAMLLHGRPSWELPSRHTVLLYAGTFDDDYLETEDAAYDGMAHPQGPIILSREAVEAGWADPHDGSNVVLHELAHLLDFEQAYADGVPSLIDSGSVVAWRKLVRREMQRARLGKSLLRRYASTSPVELFAVAVENFFERPDLLRKRHPELHDALAALLGLSGAAEHVEQGESASCPTGP